MFESDYETMAMAREKGRDFIRQTSAGFSAGRRKLIRKEDRGRGGRMGVPLLSALYTAILTGRR